MITLSTLQYRNPLVSRQRLYRACPSILLGTLFNVLDAGTAIPA